MTSTEDNMSSSLSKLFIHTLITVRKVKIIRIVAMYNSTLRDALHMDDIEL